MLLSPFLDMLINQTHFCGFMQTDHLLSFSNILVLLNRPVLNPDSLLAQYFQLLEF